MAWSGGSDIIPGTISAFTTPVSVSVETALFALTELGVNYRDLAFTVRNLDVTNAAALYVDTSESGAVLNYSPTQIIIPALSEATVEFRDVLRRNWALSASGDPAGGFPTVLVQFQIVGRQRYASAGGSRYSPRGSR